MRIVKQKKFKPNFKCRKTYELKQATIFNLHFIVFISKYTEFTNKN